MTAPKEITPEIGGEIRQFEQLLMCSSQLNLE